MSTKVQHILVDSSMVDTVSYYNDSQKLIVNFKMEDCMYTKT